VIFAQQNLLTELMKLVRAYWIDNPQLAISPPLAELELK
jgi:hypothetical protein